MGKKRTISDRFWGYVQKNPGDCWEWIGTKTPKGSGQKYYGRIKVGSKWVRAHRFSYGLNVGPIPPGMLVLHKCDNPPCVNPDHLFLGSQEDNVRDKVSKNRQATRNNYVGGTKRPP